MMYYKRSLKKFNVFKIQAFRRMTKQYFLITLGLILIVFFVFHSYIISKKQERISILSNNFVNLKTEIINEQNVVDTLTTELFIQQPNLEDLNNFLKLDYTDYFEYKTSQYMATDSSNYYGTLTFVKKIFFSYPQFAKIIFFNEESQSVTIFSNGDSDFLVRKKVDFPDTILSTTELTSFLFKGNKNNKNLLSFHKTLNNPATLQNVAEVYFIFDNESFYNEISSDNQESSGEIFLFEDKKIIYRTNENLNKKNMKLIQDDKITRDYHLVSKNVPQKIQGFIIHLYIYFILCALLIVLISFPFIIHHLRILENKVFSISRRMSDIQKGNFSSLPKLDKNSKPDEFSLIIDGLDNMANELNKYINDVYISEIKQKDYQMKAIKAQINPHFLYNTFEAIRMKAIINEDFAVAEMLYNTSQLYRTMIKGKELITLKEELMFCDTYLRLFEIRFDDNLFYDISFDNTLENIMIEKLMVQPFIENYIVHGIDSKKDNNFIEISCKEIFNDLIITVQDNGKGINKKRLQTIQKQLRENAIESTESMGLLSINYRVKELFGKDYGVTIELNSWNGITVSLCIPIQKGGC